MVPSRAPGARRATPSEAPRRRGRAGRPPQPRSRGISARHSRRASRTDRRRPPSPRVAHVKRMWRVLDYARLPVQLPAVLLVEVASAAILLETPEPGGAELDGGLVQLV